MSSDDVVITVRNLTKTYRMFGHAGDRLKQAMTFGMRKYHKEFTALDDVSFDVRKGEAIGIIGRNGSGKSTLLQLICGILKPSSGSVEVKGRIAALLELGAGFNPEFTGRENVYFQGALMGVSREEMDKRFNLITEFADIGEFIDQPVRIYSSGMFVRLAFSVSIHSDPEILVVDEALSVGDAMFVKKCMQFLREFMKRGTVVFVSHDVISIAQICKTALWIDEGVVRREGRADDVVDAYYKGIYSSPYGVVGSEKINSENSESYNNLLITKRDMRQDLLNASPHRNDIEIIGFPSGETGFGAGGAEILLVSLFDDSGSPLSCVVGGELVSLHIQCVANTEMRNPLIGFIVKDESGLALFGDNTYLRYLSDPPNVSRGQRIEAVFDFRMPILPIGKYVIAAAIADGSQQNHIQHHWVSDALVLNSISSSVVSGVVGVPMHGINLVVS